jgi:hypothetical protein
MPACLFECQPLTLAPPIAAFYASLLPTSTAATYGTGQNGDPRDGRGSYAQKGKKSLDSLVRHGELPPPDWVSLMRETERKTMPTPTATDANESGVAGNWTKESGRHSGTTLTDFIQRMPPTPRARDWKGDGKDCLPSALGVGGKLHPRFVEWMMGFPLGWTDVRGDDETSSD